VDIQESKQCKTRIKQDKQYKSLLDGYRYDPFLFGSSEIEELNPITVPVNQMCSKAGLSLGLLILHHTGRVRIGRAKTPRPAWGYSDTLYQPSCTKLHKAAHAHRNNLISAHEGRCLVWNLRISPAWNLWIVTLESAATSCMFGSCADNYILSTVCVHACLYLWMRCSCARKYSWQAFTGHLSKILCDNWAAKSGHVQQQHALIALQEWAWRKKARVQAMLFCVCKFP